MLESMDKLAERVVLEYQFRHAEGHAHEELVKSIGSMLAETRAEDRRYIAERIQDLPAMTPELPSVVKTEELCGYLHDFVLELDPSTVHAAPPRHTSESGQLVMTLHPEMMIVVNAEDEQRLIEDVVEQSDSVDTAITLAEMVGRPLLEGLALLFPSNADDVLQTLDRLSHDRPANCWLNLERKHNSSPIKAQFRWNAERTKIYVSIAEQRYQRVNPRAMPERVYA